MDEQIKAKILRLLDSHRVMTIATLRPDGWPQATTVGYVNEGLSIFFLCGPTSQKAVNLARDARVSVTIDEDTDDVMAIEGLSIAAHAHHVSEPAEVMRILGLLAKRYPPQASVPDMPGPEAIRIFRLVPKVISVLDYSKGFGHTDLIMC